MKFKWEGHTALSRRYSNNIVDNEKKSEKIIKTISETFKRNLSMGVNVQKIKLRREKNTKVSRIKIKIRGNLKI